MIMSWGKRKMKKTLLINYNLMMIAWCFLLNGYGYIGVFISLIGTVVLLTSRKQINYWRLVCLTIFLNSISTSLLSKSGINIYFNALDYMLVMAAINCSLVNELIYYTKKNFIYPIFVFIFVGMLVSSLIAQFSPAELYSIFTKDNLMLMICFIFLPYFFSLGFCLVYKNIQLDRLVKELVKQFIRQSNRNKKIA